MYDDFDETERGPVYLTERKYLIAAIALIAGGTLVMGALVAGAGGAVVTLLIGAVLVYYGARALFVRRRHSVS
jgi:membrane associated rhomboid family serine protease